MTPAGPGCLAASRDGDVDALLALLDPDVVLRADSDELNELGVPVWAEP